MRLFWGCYDFFWFSRSCVVNWVKIGLPKTVPRVSFGITLTHFHAKVKMDKNDIFATLETPRKLDRVNFCKDFWDFYEGQGKNWLIAVEHVPSNDPRINCGTHFGSSSLLVSEVANDHISTHVANDHLSTHVANDHLSPHVANDHLSPHVWSSKTLLEFWIWFSRCGFRIPVTGFRIPFSGTCWIPDSSCQRCGIPDSLGWITNFYIPGFRIPPAKISRIPESRHTLYEATYQRAECGLIRFIENWPDPLSHFLF